MRSVFSYSDYRKYLRDFYLQKKARVSGYSYRSFALAAGLRSQNYLKLVIDGQRDLTPATIHAFARALDLDFEEESYFEALVLFAQAESADERRYHDRKLAALKRKKPRAIERMTLNSLIEQWYYPAVWLALSGCEEGINTADVAARVGITEQQAEAAVQILVDANVVTIDNGHFRLRADCILHHNKDLFRKAQRSYLEGQLMRSVDQFKRSYSRGAKFYSHTFSTAHGNFAAYDQRVKNFMLELNAASDEEPVEDIVQLNIQMFAAGAGASRG